MGGRRRVTQKWQRANEKRLSALLLLRRALEPWIQLLWCNSILTLGGASDQKGGVYLSTPLKKGKEISLHRAGRWSPWSGCSGPCLSGSSHATAHTGPIETVFNPSTSHHHPELVTWPQIRAAQWWKGALWRHKVGGELQAIRETFKGLSSFGLVSVVQWKAEEF